MFLTLFPGDAKGFDQCNLVTPIALIVFRCVIIANWLISCRPWLLSVRILEAPPILSRRGFLSSPHKVIAPHPVGKICRRSTFLSSSHWAMINWIYESIYSIESREFLALSSFVRSRYRLHIRDFSFSNYQVLLTESSLVTVVFSLSLFAQRSI